MPKKEYQLNVRKGSYCGWSGAKPLEEIAIQARLEHLKEQIMSCGDEKLVMRIDDVRLLPQKEVNFGDAEKALVEYVMLHGVSALVNLTIHMTMDTFDQQVYEVHKQVTGKDATCIKGNCHWCKSKDCANCPAFKD